ncbi:MAG: hypothetical protein RL352_348 [Actinomycetota bacterium]|nr:hypothetical protein [Acidimicrobiia bacterium]NBX12831.1 hypothetical protein [Acidimicrobiia bacterium]NDE20618.1 hypothetical protein [Actinomycetota bacterium]NDF69193.1 hypothetical protein [Actinomycetota bacterium]NDG10613.1 hypothetical protein [Actinomycetota bacterium]
MKPTPDARDIESMLKRWAEVDAEAGRMAAERRREVLGARASDELPEYEFGKKPNDWVHLDWMRPLRFMYRNLPFGLRMALKKRLVR